MDMSKRTKELPMTVSEICPWGNKNLKPFNQSRESNIGTFNVHELFSMLQCNRFKCHSSSSRAVGM